MYVTQVIFLIVCLINIIYKTRVWKKEIHLRTERRITEGGDFETHSLIISPSRIPSFSGA